MTEGKSQKCFMPLLSWISLSRINMVHTQTQASTTNEVAKTLNQLLLFRKVKKDKTICQGTLSRPLVKVTGLCWIRKIHSTTAFPSQTLDISRAIKNQHPKKIQSFHPSNHSTVLGWCNVLISHSRDQIYHVAAHKATKATVALCQPPTMSHFLLAKAWGATSHGTAWGLPLPHG